MNTKALRQKILDLAIHGKLVPQDPNDEPASVLLQRIKVEKERLIKEGKIKRAKKSKATCDKPHYENVPFEVPSSWVWCKLHNIIQITNGRSQKYVENVNGKYPIYGSGGVIGKAVDYLCEAGSTIIGRKGTINNPLFVEERFWNIDTAFGMKPMYAISDLYFFYFCQYFDFSKLDKSTAVPSLTQSAIGEVFIPIPPINEQKRITDGISYWLGFIDTLESNLINLQLAIKQTKSKILNLAIHGKLVPQDPTDEPASELLKRINPKAEIACDNGQYGKLPKGWCETILGSIGTWQSGATPSRLRKDYYGGNIPWLKTGDLNDGIIEFIPECITERALEETSVKLNPTGSILIAMYGATIGKIGILSKPATTNQACCACINYLADKMFLFYFLFGNKEKFIAMGGGGAQPNISKEKIIHTHIPLPPLSEQHRIVAKIEELFAQLDNIAAVL